MPCMHGEYAPEVLVNHKISVHCCNGVIGILCIFAIKIKSNLEIFHYTRCETPMLVTSLWGPFPRHSAQVTQLLLTKCRSGGEPLAMLCPI